MQLVRDHGKAGTTQVVPAAFIQAATTVQRDAFPGQDYGYLFWHRVYKTSCGEHSGWFMGGNGGNAIVMVPDLDAVIVVTRENYNTKGMHQQTTKLIEDQILPPIACAGTDQPIATNATWIRDVHTGGTRGDDGVEQLLVVPAARAQRGEHGSLSCHGASVTSSAKRRRSRSATPALGGVARSSEPVGDPPLICARSSRDSGASRSKTCSCHAANAAAVAGRVASASTGSPRDRCRCRREGRDRRVRRGRGVAHIKSRGTATASAIRLRWPKYADSAIEWTSVSSSSSAHAVHPPRPFGHTRRDLNQRALRAAFP